MKAKKLVVAYCRISTLDQKKNGLGIEIQVRDAMLFAQERGFFIDRFYRDEAESGVVRDRPQLTELLRLCKEKRVATVIIPSLDRLSRDVRLSENLFYQFERYGTQVLIADMPNYNGQDRRDVLIRQIREAIAEDNRKEIIERLLKGRQERVRKGLFPGGNIAYGYYREGKKVFPNPVEVAMVGDIFELDGQKKSRTQIALALNAKGLRRRNGKPWTSRQVCAVLSLRELYEQGRIHYGPAFSIDPKLILLKKEKQ
jgi:site-specific DNA recombinase